MRSIQLDVPLPSCGGLFGHLDWANSVEASAMYACVSSLKGPVRIKLVACGHEDRKLDLLRLARTAADTLASGFFLDDNSVVDIIVGRDGDLPLGFARLNAEEIRSSSTPDNLRSVAATVH